MDSDHRYTIPKGKVDLVSPILVTIPWDEGALGAYGVDSPNDAAVDAFAAKKLVVPSQWFRSTAAIPGRTRKGELVVTVVAGPSHTRGRIVRGEVMAVPVDSPEAAMLDAAPTA